jgi:hypothetical protein
LKTIAYPQKSFPVVLELGIGANLFPSNVLLVRTLDSQGVFIEDVINHRFPFVIYSRTIAIDPFIILASVLPTYVILSRLPDKSFVAEIHPDRVNWPTTHYMGQEYSHVPYGPTGSDLANVGEDVGEELMHKYVLGVPLVIEQDGPFPSFDRVGMGARIRHERDIVIWYPFPHTGLILLAIKVNDYVRFYALGKEGTQRSVRCNNNRTAQGQF